MIKNDQKTVKNSQKQSKNSQKCNFFLFENHPYYRNIYLEEEVFSKGPLSRY